ncbi:hypothetical protein BG60_23490 [Caballeronia zhejiangensis]|uniref:Uncharacterized protein n=1 Tax=Caballeronia zhejiangensis TaxID=871203 RepID=A0A656QCS2_9BURK|nr:hypothetical protein BG60_23490 [Caballeronia zhejiangensis]
MLVRSITLDPQLSNIVVGTGIQSRYSVFRGVFRRQHENGNGVSLCAPMFKQTSSRKTRKPQVQHNHVVARGRPRELGGLSVLRSIHCEGRVAQTCFKAAANEVIIFNQKHAHVVSTECSTRILLVV